MLVRTQADAMTDTARDVVAIAAGDEPLPGLFEKLGIGRAWLDDRVDLFTNFENVVDRLAINFRQLPDSDRALVFGMNAVGYSPNENGDCFPLLWLSLGGVVTVVEHAWTRECPCPQSVLHTALQRTEVTDFHIGVVRGPQRVHRVHGGSTDIPLRTAGSKGIDSCIHPVIRHRGSDARSGDLIRVLDQTAMIDQ